MVFEFYVIFYFSIVINHQYLSILIDIRKNMYTKFNIRYRFSEPISFFKRHKILKLAAYKKKKKIIEGYNLNIN